MTTIAGRIDTGRTLTRRQRAAATVTAALRGGVLGAAVAAVAWFLAGAIAATAFVVLLVTTVALALYGVARGRFNATVWTVLAAAWAVVALERWAVQAHGGLWVALAAWLGVVIGARRAGISKWSLPLLGFPIVSAAIAVAAGQDLLSPWGSSWLWVAAVLGPVLGARTMVGEAPDSKRPSA